MLRTRRRIFVQKPDWALSRALALTGRDGAPPAAGQKSREGEGATTIEADGRDNADDDLLAEEFAEIDAVLARSSKILSGADVPGRKDEASRRDQNGLIYDLDWNEEERLAEWRRRGQGQCDRIGRALQKRFRNWAPLKQWTV